MAIIPKRYRNNEGMSNEKLGKLMTRTCNAVGNKVISFDPYNGRILVAGRPQRSVDQLSNAIGLKDAFEFLVSNNTPYGVHSYDNIKLY